MTWSKGSHGNTYGGNPIACAAALATIDLIENQYLENAQHVGEYALSRLREIQNRNKSIGQVRGMGLMIGIEFVTDQQTRQPDEELRNRIIHLAFQNGLLLLGCGKSSIRISPGLCINQQEIDEGLNIFEEVISLAETQKLTANAA